MPKAWLLFRLWVLLLYIEFHGYHCCCSYHHHDYYQGSSWTHYVARLFLCSWSSSGFPSPEIPTCIFPAHNFFQQYLQRLSLLSQGCYLCPTLSLILQPRDTPKLSQHGFHPKACKGEWRIVQGRHWRIKLIDQSAVVCRCFSLPVFHRHSAHLCNYEIQWVLLIMSGHLLPSFNWLIFFLPYEVKKRHIGRLCP